MKKILYLSCFLYMAALHAQQPKILVSQGYGGDEFKVALNPDNTFHAFMINGTIENRNGKKFLVPNQPQERVEVAVVETGKTDSITLNLYISKYKSHRFFVAYSKEKQAKPDYKKLSDLLHIDENDYDYSDDEAFVNIRIPKSTFLYVIKKNYFDGDEKSPNEFSFQIPDNSKVLDIYIHDEKIEDLELREEDGTYNLVMSNSDNGERIYRFKEESYYKNLQYATLVEKKVSSDNFASDDDYAMAADSVVTYSGEKAEVQGFSTLNEALNYLKTNPKSCLWISKEDDESFKKVKDFYAQYLYENPIDEKDKEEERLLWTFYKATKSDESFLKKLKVNTKSQNIILKNGNTVLLQSEESVVSFSNDDYYYSIFSNIGTVDQQIIQANNIIKNEAIFNNKNATISELTQAFSQISNENLREDMNEVVVATESVKVADDDYEYAAAADSAAAYAEPYIPFDFKSKLYQSSIDKKTIDAQWKKILNYYSSKKEYNNSFIQAAMAELLDFGYTKSLYNENKNSYNEIDFQAWNYVFEYYKQALKEDSLYDSQEYYEEEDINYIRKSLIEEALFTQHLSLMVKDSKNEAKYEGNIQKFLNETSDTYYVSSYIWNLIENKKTEKVVSQYKQFLSKYDTNNIIENLNELYEQNEENDYNSWSNFKDVFSSLANSVAWYFVENKIYDKKYIQDAISWSELSLKIDKNSAHYLDTLAQLQYINGNKQKAIELQTKALQNGVDKRNPLDMETLDEMSKTLTKMQNGTY